MLSCVDLQQNMIDGSPEDMVRLFSSMQSLACLYMQGNPVVSSMHQYRKRMIAAIPTLTYLDDRPVFSLERTCAKAWAIGGLTAERTARELHKDIADANSRRHVEFMTNLRKNTKMRLKSLEEQSVGNDIAVCTQSDKIDMDHAWHSEPEPSQLIAARTKLKKYSVKEGQIRCIARGKNS
jgi:dynein assembly factor 1